MEFFKKQSLGFYFGICTAIIGIIGAVLYFGNTKTAYFSPMGVNSAVAACLIIAVICELVYIIGNEAVGRNMVLDILPAAGAILFAVGLVNFVADRVNGIAAIMTFAGNESTMADLQNTIVAFVFCGIAFVLAVVTSFFRVVKDN